MICETASDVIVRLMALASFLDISETECPLYNAIAASIMVGVGQYRPCSHCGISIADPPEKDKIELITCGKLSTLHLIGR